MGSFFGFERNASIYLASEIGTTGSITSVAWFINSLSSPAASLPMEIYMKQTTASLFSATTTVATELTGATLVWSGNLSGGSLVANAWNTITLTTPFNYTGGANNLEIIVLTNATGAGNEGSTAKQVRFSNAGANRSQSWQADTSPPTGVGSFFTIGTNLRPNVQIQIASSPCAGTPTPGNTNSTSSLVCATIPFTLSLQNATSGSGVSYQWQTSTNGGASWDPAGPNAATWTTSITVPTDFRCVVTCSAGPSSGTSTPISIALNAPTNCYCASTGTSGSTQITNVTVTGTTTLNNTSAGNAGYANFTSVTPTVSASAGDAVTFSVTATSDPGRSIFVDWNNDGIFTVPAERVFTSAGFVLGASTGSFNVPVAQPAGSFRMRVVADWNGTTPAPCNNNINGETEDYTFVVFALTPCAGTPNAGTVPSTASVCPSGTTSLTASGVTSGPGISYQWQEFDGTNWVNAVGGSGATTLTYTTPVLSGTVLYRMQTTCAISGQSNETNTATVSVALTPACYCAASTVNLGWERFTGFTLADINDALVNNVGYTDRTSIVGNVNASQAYPLTVTYADPTNGAPNGYNTDQVLVWIDFNQNGVFTDAGELVFSGTPSFSPQGGIINIPVTALGGQTIMRVRLHDTSFGPNATPCGNANYGQVRDYALNITPCSGPLPTATAGGAGSYCQGNDVNLTVSSDVGTSFVWSGPNGFNSTDQNPTLSNVTGLNAGTYLVVVSTGPGTCSNSSTVQISVTNTPSAPGATTNYSICNGAAVPGGQGLTASGVTPSSSSISFPGNSFNSEGTTPVIRSTVNVPALPAGAVVNSATLVLTNIGALSPSFLSEMRFSMTGAYTLAQTAIPGAPAASGNLPTASINLPGFPAAGGTINLLMNESFNDAINPDGVVASAEIVLNYTLGTSWYSASTGGTNYGTGSPFNPVTAGAVNNAVDGVYTIWAGTEINGCPSTRIPAYFSVGSENVTLEFYTTSTPADASWQIEDVATSAILYSGQGFVMPPDAVFPFSYCLPNNRSYKLRVTDNGNGVSGYQLRYTPTQARIIDNIDNLGTGTSEITGNTYSFSLPVSNNSLIYTSCDKLWWRSNEFIVAAEDPAVSALWVVGGANSVQSNNTGYEFWFYNPNGGYSFRKFRPHNVSDGFGSVGATRACHLRINNWPVANHIPQFDLMNVRVRSRVNGNNTGWGAACRFIRDEALAACPPTKLMDIPGNQFLSCNQFRQWNVSGSRIHARPVTGANLYQWRFRIPAENVEIIRTSTSYFLNLNWTALVAAPLETGKTYEVDVRASRDGGTTWCGFGGDPWGDICSLTIGTPPAVGGNQNMSLSADGALAMWPNPNNGTEVWISLEGIDTTIETVTVDIHDLFGKRVSARILPTQDGSLYTALPLNGDLAAGLYTVTVIAGEAQYVQRLVIQN